MLASFWIRLAALGCAVGALASAHAADFVLTQRRDQTGVSTSLVVPTTRGAANTTWFGWDSFGAISDPIDDSTPDIGTTTVGVRFRTVTGGDHTSSSGNYYSFEDTPDEEITVVTNGTPGAAGKTTVILQLVTLFGSFPGAWDVGTIDGFRPVALMQGTNRSNKGQLWAVWELPGNATTYTIRLKGTPGVSMYSFDKVEIDTWFDASGASHPDRMGLALPADFTLTKETGLVTPTTRGSLNTTRFGWDTFEDPATYAVPGNALADATPDIVDFSTPVGVKFESLHTNKNRASSGNFYSGANPATSIVNEKITVVTRGTPGSQGKTTILLQMIAGSFAGNPSDFASNWQFSAINGVSPAEVLQTRNAAGFGQVWVRWELPGNESTYELTLTSASNAHMSFDRIEIETWFSPDGASHPDSMILSETPLIAHLMDQVSGAVIPSSRGGRGTTYFGWDTFGNPGPASVIDDSTPDLGSDPTGLARFRTTNGEIHQFAGGANLYFLSGTLAEEVTVPTDGVPGSAGFTTIILQITSALGGQGGTTFATDIALSSLNGVAPIVVQGSNSVSAHLWAKWIVPGNQPTYTIAISGPPGQAHFSFDRVIVDTKFSRYEGVGDTMRAKTVAITTTTLADAIKNQPFSANLSADGGSAPYVWTVASGSSLPAGLSLSSAGVLSGQPSAIGDFSFTVQVEEDGGFTDARTFSLQVEPSLKILTPATLPTAVVGVPYEVTFAADEGVLPLAWSLANGTLPDGLTLNPNGTLSGTPTTAGNATLTLAVTDDEDSVVERTFQLPVSPVLLTPVMNPLNLPATSAGAEFLHTLSAQNYPSSFQVLGLPAGLKLTPAAGLIAGRVPLAGVYPLQVRALNTAGASPWVSGRLIVRALPPMQQGTFTGWSTRQAVNSSLGSLFSLKTTPNGAYTLSVRTGARALSARGFLNASPPHLVLPNFAGATLSLSIHPTTGALSGSHGPASVSGWRAVWDKNLNPASSRAGYYSLALDLASAHDADSSLPRGSGFASFTVPDNGLLRLAGKTADGQNLLSSGPLGPNGEILIYALQHANQGSVLGQLLLSEGANGDFSDNTLAATALTWQKPLTKGRTHTDAFGPLSLNVAGGYLAPSAKGQTVLGLPDLGAFDLEFTEGGIANSATTANVSGIQWTDKFTALMPATGNDARVSLRLNRNTGALTGTFTLTETTPPLVRRNVPFTGQIVRGLADDDVRAVGYFLLPQIPTSGQRPNQSPILSGSVLLTQPTP